MTLCVHPLPVSVLVTTALFVVSLRADDDRSQFAIAFRAENPWPVGVLGMIAPDGSRQKFLDFKRPKQKSWQWGARLPDGRVILTSLEAADVAEIRAGKVCFGKIRVGEVYSGEVRAEEFCSSEVRVTEVYSGEVRVDEDCSGEV